MSHEKVLLIFPPFKWGATDRFCQPLGILTLATVLKKDGINISVVDLSAEGWGPKKLAHYIKKGNFTHIGITIITPFRSIPYQILKIAKKINPQIITLVGGPHVTYIKNKVFLECEEIDIAIAGEAELKITEIIQNPQEKFYNLGIVKEIDNIPIPDRSFIRHLSYNDVDGLWVGESASMKWVRGCPWRKCRFCSRSILTMAHRRRSPEKIIKEIDYLQNKMGYKNLIIIDDSLEISSPYTQKIFKLKIKHGLDIPFWTLARADHINEEGLKLMKRAGGVGILIGLESIVPRMIDLYQKIETDPKKWYQTLDNAFELTNKYNIITVATFILGGPTESLKDMKTTIDYCRTAKVDFVQPFPFLYIVGSDFWRDAVKEGYLESGQYFTYNDKMYGSTELTTDELFELAKHAGFLINSPVLNPRRTIGIIRKFVDQRNFELIGRNLARVPQKIVDMLNHHSYEMVPEELHG